MRKPKPISKIVYTDKQFMKWLLQDVVDRVKRDAKRGLDVNKKRFKPYTEQYRKRKSAGKIKGQLKFSGGHPNLTLSGKMLKNFRIIKEMTTKTSGVVGWAEEKSAAKVRYNDEMGRQIVKDEGFPFAKHIEKYFERELSKKFDKNIKLTSERITFKIGK